MSLDTRLSRLMPVLTAKERGILVLKSFKDNTEEDPKWRRAMPPDQVAEFNRYILLMNGVNLRLGSLLMLIYQSMQTSSQQIGWLASLVLFQFACDSAEWFLFIRTKEPITESEYADRKRQTEKELIPIDGLAEMEADACQDWAPEDLYTTEDGKELVSDAAWERVKRGKAAFLKGLIRQGTLEGKRHCGKLSVLAASYYGWKGQEIPVHPDRDLHYEVVPDSQAEEVRRWQEDREELLLALRPFDRTNVGDSDEGDEGLAAMRKLLEEKVVDGGQQLWGCLEAVRRVGEEVAAEFDGEDPWRPKWREVLDATIKELQDIASGHPPISRAFELPEPTEENMENMRWLLMRDP